MDIYMQFSPWVKGITVHSEGSSGNDIWRDRLEKNCTLAVLFFMDCFCQYLLLLVTTVCISVEK